MKKLPIRRFFVVIHTLTGDGGVDHVIKQTALAQEHGADGVFIIPDYAKGGEREATTFDQFAYLGILQHEFPNFLIGVNFLANIQNIVPKIYSYQPNLFQIDGSRLGQLQKEKLPNTEFFCGVAFKYSPTEHLRGEALRKHCLQVAEIANVPTTSGEATGVSANLGKIEEIRSYLPENRRMGLASGVTEENVLQYLDIGVTDFLVATSLVKHINELDFDILDPKKVSNMAKIIHSYDK